MKLFISVDLKHATPRLGFWSTNSWPKFDPMRIALRLKPTIRRFVGKQIPFILFDCKAEGVVTMKLLFKLACVSRLVGWLSKKGRRVVVSAPPPGSGIAFTAATIDSL